MNEFDDPDILAMLAGEPTPTPQVRANALRKPKPPKIESTSITQNVESPQASPAPMNAAQSRSTLGRQAVNDIESAQQEIDRYTGPQDYTAMQDYAKQRTQGGGQSLLLSLAAQHAGKEYAPLQSAYLKRAMEARDPLKTATGFIDEGGQHIEDPQAKAEQRIKLAQGRMAKAQQILQSNATAEEKAAAQAEALAMRREMMEANLEMRRMTAGIASQGAADRQAARQGVADDRRFRGEDRMKNDFEQVTQKSREGLAAAQQAQVVLNKPPGTKLSNVEQQALITLFNKFLDPGSVVREGEFDRMAKGMGLGQRVQNWQDKILRGSIITPAMAAEIGNVARLYEADALRAIQTQSPQYETTAQQRGYDPAAIITNPNWRTSRPAAEAGPPPGAVRTGPRPAPAAASPDAPPPGAVRVKR